MSIELRQGDSLEILKTIAPLTADHCVTSPAYFQLCDYQHDRQYGLEPTIAEYLTKLTAVFSDVYRILPNGGVLWVVIGDTMSNYSPIRAKGQRRKAGEYLMRRDRQEGYFEKEPMGIPFLLIDYLRKSGWRHRNTLIWDKDFPGTISNSDSAPTTHEFLLQFVKWQGVGRMMASCAPMPRSVLRHRPEFDAIHPCPMPLALAKDLILPLQGQTIIDPFVGRGTVLRAARDFGMSGIGIDLDCDRAHEYLGQQVLNLTEVAN
jgi:site-specific DNA-methyltransferase (cytosine-N4-specific)